MAHLRVDFFADTLGLSTSMTVVLPQSSATQIGIEAVAEDRDPPVLYLLHGLSDDDTIWTRHTSIERYAAQRGLAVVMPQVHRSFYADEVHGNRYWTFLSDELPAIVGKFFRVSTRRADTYVAGLSMGGYGAMKWALRRPERFAAVASLSGVLDMARRTAGEPDLFRPIFGDEPVEGTGDDVVHLLGRADPMPRLYVCCGTEDGLYPDNVTFVDACRARDIPVTTDFGPGTHEWGYWDDKIQDVLAWMLD